MLKSISVSRQYAPLRVCAEICLYFYAVSLFSFRVLYTASDERGVHAVVSNLIAPWSLQLSVLVAACFVLGFLAVRVDSAALRFVLSLLPGLSFLMSPFEPSLLIHAAAWLYFVIVMTVGNFEVYLDVYRRRVAVMLFGALLLTVSLIIFHFGTDDWYGRRLFGGELYGLLFFVLSVLSLRGMRTGPGAPGLLRVLDAACVVVLPALLVAVFFLLRGAVPAITALFSLLTRFLLWLGRILFPGRELPEAFHPPEEQDVNKVVQEKASFLPAGHDHSPGEEMMAGENLRVELPPRVVFGLMIVFLAAALVFIAIRLLRRRDAAEERPGPMRERIEKLPPEGLLRHRPAEAALPAGVRQIRRAYRAYLEHLRSLRMNRSPSDTSEDVLAASTKLLDLPENRRLRELYIAARYGDPKAVTPRQAAEAKRCLSVIETAAPRQQR